VRLQNQNLMPCATCQPTATHPKHNPVDKAIFANADHHLPSTIKLYVCRLKDENVVNPPQTPTISSCCSAVLSLPLATCRRRPANAPISVEPTMFTTSVPNGSVSPKRSATRPDHQYRHMLPTAPPKNTRSMANFMSIQFLSFAIGAMRHGAREETARRSSLPSRYRTSKAPATTPYLAKDPRPLPDAPH
jgi:hypothetical protein